jgi:catechol 2,3-dioxygenase-like lactoylglutathione lyase family enzyme
MDESPITSIGQIHISVTDLERSTTWYSDVLGLQFLFSVPGQPMAFLQCGETRLYLGIPENENFRSQPILYFAVGDIDAAVSQIEGRGGVFDSRPHVVHRDATSEMWLVSLTDPDGLPVLLMETRKIASDSR